MVLGDSVSFEFRIFNQWIEEENKVMTLKIEWITTLNNNEKINARF